MLLYWNRRLSALTVEEPQVQILVGSIPGFSSRFPGNVGFALRPLLAEELGGKSPVPDVRGVSPEGVVNSPPPWGSVGRNGGVPRPAPRAGQQTARLGLPAPAALGGGERRRNAHSVWMR